MARDPDWRINWPLKRVFDVVVGGLLLIALSPVLLLGAACVLIDSGRPIFYRQVRLGRGGRPFTIVKLRTMRAGAEDSTGEALATSTDPRVTRAGRWLRRHRIDEIPQLWNVLAGAMSLVGPRPERPGFADVFSSDVAGYSQRYVVPPGVTGLAQVHGDYHSSPETKVRYDLAYIANWSLWLDLHHPAAHGQGDPHLAERVSRRALNHAGGGAGDPRAPRHQARRTAARRAVAARAAPASRLRPRPADRA